MTDKEIKSKVIKELNGTKSMSKQQVDNFIDYMFFLLPIEENSENYSREFIFWFGTNMTYADKLIVIQK